MIKTWFAEWSSGGREKQTKNSNSKTKKQVNIKATYLCFWSLQEMWDSKVKRNKYFVWFGLVWFYGISTIVGYLMPNPR